MKFQKVLVFGAIALFVIVNRPTAPVPIRMLIYVLFSILSLTASALLFYYYMRVPESQISLLTTAAKSVLASHMASIMALYGYLIFYSMFLEDVEQDWKKNSEESCYWPMSSISVNFMFSLVVFQLLRAAFEVDPYRVLSLNHDKLACPLTITICSMTVTHQLFTYLHGDTLCDKQITEQLLYKLNIKIDYNKVTFIPFNQRIVLSYIASGLQLFIFLYRKSRILIRYLLKRTRRKIKPANNINVQANITMNKDISIIDMVDPEATNNISSSSEQVLNSNQNEVEVDKTDKEISFDLAVEINTNFTPADTAKDDKLTEIADSELSTKQDNIASTTSNDTNTITEVSSSGYQVFYTASTDNHQKIEETINQPGTSQQILNPIKINTKQIKITRDDLSSLPNFNKSSFSNQSDNAYVKASKDHNWSKFGIMFLFIIPLFLSYLIDDDFFLSFGSICLDCFLFLSPIIAFNSSTKVTEFTKLKIHQLKVRLGFV